MYVDIEAGMRVTRTGKILFVARVNSLFDYTLNRIYQCDKDGSNLKVMAEHDDQKFAL